MDAVCPLCNGLSHLRAICSVCGQPLEDNGAVSDYLGPYAPYEYSPRMEQTANQCVHLLTCINCGNDSYAIIQNDVI